MKQNNHNLNDHVARKMFDLLQQAELAFQMKGQKHADYLKPFRARAIGQLRMELTRIIDLGDRAEYMIDFFMKEFGA